MRSEQQLIEQTAAEAAIASKSRMRLTRQSIWTTVVVPANCSEFDDGAARSIGVRRCSQRWPMPLSYRSY